MLCYLFVSLLGIGDLGSASASEALTSGREIWTEHIRQMGKGGTKLDVVDAERELHKLSLLRMMLEWAGGREDAPQRQRNLELPAKDNLALVVEHLGIDVAAPVDLWDSDTAKIKEALLKHQSLMFGVRDIARLQEIPRSVLIGLPSEVYV